MKTLRTPAPCCLIAAAVLVGVFSFIPVSAQEAPTSSPPAASPATAPPATPTRKPSGLPKLNYSKPPGATGVPTDRQKGGTRGGGDGVATIYVLAPSDHVSLTTQAQPKLFWYQGQPSKTAFELTLIEPKKARPLLSFKDDKPQPAGIRALSLAQAGVTLTPGVTYQWHVALIPDPENRSKDVIATGYIKRIEAPADLSSKTTSAPLAERAAHFAQAGLWYDALQAISTAMAAEPKNTELRKLRGSLLDQARLPEAAAVDRR